MKYIQNLKIRYKLLVLISINIFFFVIAGFFSYQALSLLGTSQAKLIVNTTVLYHQMNADMMHDALRADVYKAQLLNRADTAAKNALQADFSEHKEIFFESLEQLSYFSINDTIDEAVIQVMPVLQNYIQQSDQIIKMAFQTIPADSLHFANELAGFSRVFDELADKMHVLSTHISNSSKALQASANRQVQMNKFAMSSIILICICCVWYISKKIANQLTAPIIQAKEVMKTLAVGDLPNVQLSPYTDEVSEMMHSLYTLTHNLSDIKGFANDVGQGKFEAAIEVFNNSGELGTSLTTMRKSLQVIAEKEANHRWINTKLTEANDILRLSNHTQQEILDKILHFIIQCMEGSQGCISLVDDQNPADKHLRIHACYALGRKKYLNKRMGIEEGLPGRALLEGDVLYLTDIPTDYIAIKSGLGTTPAQSLLIVPLRVGEEMVGVLELAFIHVLSPSFIEFAERLSSILAQYISTDTKNIRTAHLLAVTQKQKAEIQTQEEDVRQNMEELYAIQEDLRRREEEYLQQIEDLKAQLSPVLIPSSELNPYK